ncbi:hypothetical protein KAR91_77785, partial [Candidatus Pacearchaeota archaeon]|nr:hypothetical protein [Candidatus Pacearchaeota archaeon]
MIDLKNSAMGKIMYVDDKAQVGKDCVIGAGCRIYGKVKLTSRTYVGDNTIIYGPATVGKKTFIGPNCLLGHPDRGGLKKKISNPNQLGTNSKNDILEIGEECIIRSGSIIYTNVELGRGVELG